VIRAEAACARRSGAAPNARTTGKAANMNARTPRVVDTVEDDVDRSGRDQTSQQIMNKTRMPRSMQEDAYRTLDAGRLSPQTVSQTDMIPTNAYMGGVIASMALSALLMMRGKRNLALFIGLWPPTILNMALFSKLMRSSEAEKDERSIGALPAELRP
jgi:hypothetical protein